MAGQCAVTLLLCFEHVRRRGWGGAPPLGGVRSVGQKSEQVSKESVSGRKGLKTRNLGLVFRGVDGSHQGCLRMNRRLPRSLSVC